MDTDQINPRPEPTTYDKVRHEEMRPKRNGLYGIPKVFVNGLAAEKPRCAECGRLLVWCDCASGK